MGLPEPWGHGGFHKLTHLYQEVGSQVPTYLKKTDRFAERCENHVPPGEYVSWRNQCDMGQGGQCPVQEGWC